MKRATKRTRHAPDAKTVANVTKKINPQEIKALQLGEYVDVTDANKGMARQAVWAFNYATDRYYRLLSTPEGVYRIFRID